MAHMAASSPWLGLPGDGQSRYPVGAGRLETMAVSLFEDVMQAVDAAYEWEDRGRDQNLILVDGIKIVLNALSMMSRIGSRFCVKETHDDQSRKADLQT
jgi:hypothetical protein